MLFLCPKDKYYFKNEKEFQNLTGCLSWLSHFLVVPSQSFSIWSRRREKDRELGVQ
jgi:hypothetical protein